MPALSGCGLVVAALVYPRLFYVLGESNLVIGAFLGSTVLLLVPLVCMSAMNPLLIAIRPPSSDALRDDARAGRVLFISTLGSVAGVNLTAFVLVRFFLNFTSVLLLSLAASLLSLTLALFECQLPPRRRYAAIALAGAVRAGQRHDASDQPPVPGEVRRADFPTPGKPVSNTVSSTKRLPFMGTSRSSTCSFEPRRGMDQN